MNTDSPAVRLHARKPRIFWGHVIKVLIEQGWNPPSPDAKITDAIIKAIEDAVELGSAVTLDRVMNKGRLTEAELRVTLLVADGASDKQIMEQLGIASQTVHYHLGNIYKKLGARSRAHAVSICFKEGIVH